MVFTRVSFSPSHREIPPTAPFTTAAAALRFEMSASPLRYIYPTFDTTGTTILQKPRYYAGAGMLEEILSTQGIDTAVMSGIRTLGVILSTVYRFYLNYKVFVVSSNIIKSPLDTLGIDAAILEGVIPKLLANVITLE
jgi:hypothetical protein